MIESEHFTPEQTTVLVENSILISRSGLADFWKSGIEYWNIYGRYFDIYRGSNDRERYPEAAKLIKQLGQMAVNADEAPFYISSSEQEDLRSFEIWKVNPVTGLLMHLSRDDLEGACGGLGLASFNIEDIDVLTQDFQGESNLELAQIVRRIGETYGWADAPSLDAVHELLLRMYNAQLSIGVEDLKEEQLDEESSRILDEFFNRHNI